MVYMLRSLVLGTRERELDWPRNTAKSGASAVISAPAPITLLRPMLTPGEIVAFSPMNELSPTTQDSPKIGQTSQQWSPILVRKPMRVDPQIIVLRPM